MQIPLQEISQSTYEMKYQLKSMDGMPIDKDMDDTFIRVATALASVEKEGVREKWKEKFLFALKNGAIAAGRIMSNVGAEDFKPKTSTINCVVSNNIQDSIEGIMQSAKEAAISLAAGCGIGYCCSSLRPEGAFINGVGATTSGPMPFMEIFDTMCFTIASAGGRRGAQMLTMHCWHPNILEFIKIKREDGRFRQFNLSVLITDEFMEAVKNNEAWELYFPIHKIEYAKLTDYYDILHRKIPFESENYVTFDDGRVACKIYKRISARDLWDTIMQSTYEFAEPGVLFIDRINQQNPLNFCEEIVATNPCG